MTTNEVEYESHDEGDRKKNSAAFYIFLAKKLCSNVTMVEQFRLCSRIEISGGVSHHSKPHSGDQVLCVVEGHL
jgi:hypothetical protein